MEIKEYKVMYGMEDTYWWYVGLRKLILSTINKYNIRGGNLRLLDAGCGTGKILESCKQYKSYGIDFSEEAIKFCKLRKLNNLLMASIADIPFKNNSFDIVISLDVLYHAGIGNDQQSLYEFNRILNNNGILLLNLPAYNFLRSKHDKAIHTRRRYVTKDLKEKIEKAGFGIEKITYRNTILLPFALIKRIMEKFIIKEDTASDLKPLPYLLNKIFIFFLIIENKMITCGFNFPFGLSIYCVARKK